MGAFGIFTFFKNRTPLHVEQGISPTITGNSGDDDESPFPTRFGRFGLDREGRQGV
jgi:hypothetical protein